MRQRRIASPRLHRTRNDPAYAKATAGRQGWGEKGMRQKKLDSRFHGNDVGFLVCSGGKGDEGTGFPIRSGMTMNRDCYILNALFHRRFVAVEALFPGDTSTSQPPAAGIENVHKIEQETERVKPDRNGRLPETAIYQPPHE